MCRSCRPNGIFSNKKSFFIYAVVRAKNKGRVKDQYGNNIGGKVLSVGFNTYVRTKPIQRFYCNKVATEKRAPNLAYKEFIHAEIMALSKLGPADRKRAYSITIYRFDNKGRPALAKPCPICQEAIAHFGIKHIFYTTPDNPLNMDFNEYEDLKDEYRDRWGGDISFN